MALPSHLVVSACLLGQPCRYDGRSCADARVIELVDRVHSAGGRVTQVCPEELGELSTPRPPAELRGGDGQAVLDGSARVERVEDGADVTDAFLLGARRALLRTVSADGALLKARSPSCGVGQTHIDGKVRDGDGVFAALLRPCGLPLHTEEDQPWS